MSRQIAIVIVHKNPEISTYSSHSAFSPNYNQKAAEAKITSESERRLNR